MWFVFQFLRGTNYTFKKTVAAFSRTGNIFITKQVTQSLAIYLRIFINITFINWWSDFLVYFGAMFVNVSTRLVNRPTINAFLKSMCIYYIIKNIAIVKH